MSNAFKCSQCGEVHEGLPQVYAFDAPIYYLGIPEDERERRASLDSDQCIIDNEYFFVRGCLDIPIVGSHEVFSWGVWVSLSEKSFRRMSDLWETPGRELEPPYFGWLSSLLPGYPDTMRLKTNVQTREIGMRPLIELHGGEHPLILEQREGISAEHAKEIGEYLLHQLPP